MDNGTNCKKYKCIKEVWAEPMDKCEAGRKGLIRDFDDTVEYAPEEGYRVVYKDGYVSWSPKKAFDEGYELI